MLNIDYNSLLKHINSNGYVAELQKETDQIAVILNIDNVQYPLFIRILSEGPVLQLLVFLPCSVIKKTINDLSRLLHLLNKEMDIPGFGMDETAGVVFYRITIPSLNKKIDKMLLDTYLNSMQVICKSFTPVIINVLQGTMTLEAVMQKAKDAHQKK
ncbi:MAG: YbjN domain-containing protein [Chlamydiota bacterium]|nr:YbjN domain-containing protein [Chlamydiota bacterium]